MSELYNSLPDIFYLIVSYIRFNLLLRYLDTSILNYDSRQSEYDIKALKSAYQ